MKSGNARPINAILSDLKKGDQQALKELQSSYRKLLVSFAYGMLGNTAEAEDIVQEVFFKLWQKRDTLDPDTRIDSYLFVAVRNDCVSLLRKQKGHKIKEVKFFYGLVYSYNALPLENEELRREIRTAIATLTPVERKYFLSAYVRGENHKEIADRYSVSVQVVKNTVSNALKKLRKKLKKKKD